MNSALYLYRTCITLFLLMLWDLSLYVPSLNTCAFITPVASPLSADSIFGDVSALRFLWYSCLLMSCLIDLLFALSIAVLTLHLYSFFCCFWRLDSLCSVFYYPIPGPLLEFSCESRRTSCVYWGYSWCFRLLVCWKDYDRLFHILLFLFHQRSQLSSVFLLNLSICLFVTAHYCCFDIFEILFRYHASYLLLSHLTLFLLRIFASRWK